MIAPVVVVSVTLCLGVAHQYFTHRGNESLATLRVGMLSSTAPVVLRIFFLAYPIVTNVAFEAFSCVASPTHLLSDRRVR